MKPVVPPFQRGGGFGTLGTSFLEPSLPEPVALWPETWGAWLSLALLAAGVLGALAQGWRRHARRRHRREAQRELLALQKAWLSIGNPARNAQLERLPRVLKGCALGSFERSRVAPLVGADWLAFLRQTAPDAGFDGPAGDALWILCERGAGALGDAAVPALFDASARWIAKHHV